MLWLLISLIPAAVLTLFSCSENRQTAKPAEKKAAEQKKKTHGGKSASKRSSRSSKTSSGSKKKGRSGKSGKTSGTKSAGVAAKSGKSSKSNKSSTSGKSSKASKSSKSGKTSTSARSSKASKRSSKDVKVDKLVAKVESEPKSTTGTESASAESTGPATAVLPPVPQIVELRAEPAELSVSQLGGLQKFNFVNKSNERRAFKVKCSDNQLYRVSPVFGIVEPHGQATIQLLRQNGVAKVDKLVLLTVKVPENAQEGAKDILASAPKESYQMTVVPIYVNA